MKRILLITDSLAIDEQCITELKKKYDVIVSTIIGGVLHCISKKSNIGLVIFGIQNGVEIYKKISLKIPAIFWSSVDDDKTRRDIEDLQNAFFVKQEITDDHLVLAVSDLFGEI